MNFERTVKLNFHVCFLSKVCMCRHTARYPSREHDNTWWCSWGDLYGFIHGDSLLKVGYNPYNYNFGYISSYDCGTPMYQAFELSWSSDRACEK